MEGEVSGPVSHCRSVAELEQGTFQVPRPDEQGAGRPAGPPERRGAPLQPRRSRELGSGGAGAGADKHSQRHIRSALRACSTSRHAGLLWEALGS